MLGKEQYKIDVNAELSNERLKSLVFFYGPLIGKEAMSFYQYLVLRGPVPFFDELNNLLTSLNISVDSFEKQCAKLNEYRLLTTLKKDERYIFVFNNPMTRKEFIKDDVFARKFILKTSGPHFQELVADIHETNSYDDYEDVSETISLESLQKWSNREEGYLKPRRMQSYDFKTRFKTDIFLKDISSNMFPYKFRTEENLRQIAILSDLYNISYDEMRRFIPKVCKLDEEEFDLKQLKYLCMNGKGEYRKVDSSEYNEAPIIYLMSLQDGKELTDYDKRIIYKLSNDYYLNSEVINVLLEHALKECDNHLYENYLYPVASDLHRNNISTAKDAIELLSKGRKKTEEKLPVYDTANNKQMSEEEFEELMALRGK
ncbi:MAG: DnaD domain protein [Erysipelotrichaceae bacterium]|nr:DnaD domain protein [Erysipelotrichaceae bacterium]